MLAAVLVPISLPPPPQLFDFLSQFVYLSPKLRVHVKDKSRRHLRYLCRFIVRRPLRLSSWHNHLLFRRIVKMRVHIASSFLRGLHFLDFYRIGCGKRVLSSAVTRTQDLASYLSVLYAAVARYGSPEALVTDGGGVFRANQSRAVYEALGIAKHEIERGRA
jgi:hypothetical protein